ncbi:hypothetical protein B4U79_16453, partial [Dinothrombium tinctorium]
MESNDAIISDQKVKSKQREIRSNFFIFNELNLENVREYEKYKKRANRQIENDYGRDEQEEDKVIRKIVEHKKYENSLPQREFKKWFRKSHSSTFDRSEQMRRDKITLNSRCENKVMPIYIRGVIEISNEKRAILINEDIVSRIIRIQKDGLILLENQLPKAEQNITRVVGINLLMSGNAALFKPGLLNYMIRTGDPEKKQFIFGGWNQAILGCPQFLCIDAHFDAILSNESNTLIVFRGKYLWRLSVDGNGKPATVENAIKISDVFPSIDTIVTAAMSDQFGNVYLFDALAQFHAYIVDLDSIAESVFPGLNELFIVVPIWDYIKRRIFRHQPFLLEKIPNSIYSAFKPRDSREIFAFEIDNIEIDAAFYSKNAYSQGGFRFWLFHGDQFTLIDFFKAARFAARSYVNKLTFGRKELSKYLDNLDNITSAANDYRFGSYEVVKLNKQFPIDIEAAFSLPNSDVYLIKNWRFLKLSSRLFQFSNLTQLQNRRIDFLGDVFKDILHCDESKYVDYGFKSYE